MGGPPARANLARSAHVALARLGAAAALAAIVSAWAAGPARASGWGSPFRIAGPVSLDISPAQLAFAPSGEAAVGYELQNVDRPAFSNAFFSLRSPTGGLAGPRRVIATQEVLGLAFSGSTLELLTGTSQPGQACCTTVQGIPFGKGRFGHSRNLLTGLTGGALGQLVPIGSGRLLAAIADQNGVWSAQSSGGNHFGLTHPLTPSGTMPQTLAATSLPFGRSAIAWTATTLAAPYGSPRAIDLAAGTSQHAPLQGHISLLRPVGHEIDELALASGSAGATAAWTESWFDSAGNDHPEVTAADLGPKKVRQLPIAGTYASSPSLAGNGTGDQVLAWKTCTASDACSVRVAEREPGTRFSAPARLGAIDPSEAPVAAVASGGEELVGWIDQGRVWVAQHQASARRFSAPRVISPTRIASDLTLSFGYGSQAIAAWTQGTVNQSVIGALYRAP